MLVSLTRQIEKENIVGYETLHPLTIGQLAWDVVEHQGPSIDEGLLWLGQADPGNM